MTQPHSSDQPADGQQSLSRHEEELKVDKRDVEHVVRFRKRVESDIVEETIPRAVEAIDLERVAPNQHDSGRVETLPDGSLSVPVLEEEIVVTKRLVTRERLIVRKHQHVEQQRVSAELRREVVEVESDVPERVDSEQRVRKVEG